MIPVTPAELTEPQDYSTRQLQAWGAACRAKFCGATKTSFPDIDALIDHLLRALIVTDLAEWATSGANLPFSGRGDSLPPELRASISSELAEELKQLVDSVVEIGMVDMYGADTGQPAEFLTRSLQLLEAVEVEPPRIEELFPDRPHPREHGWGAPRSQEEHECARSWCMRAMRTPSS